jgi:hypothetical protein
MRSAFKSECKFLENRYIAIKEQTMGNDIEVSELLLFAAFFHCFK